MEELSLKEVLIGIRDMIELDNRRKLMSNGEYLAAQTLFDAEGGKAMCEKHPELYYLLNQCEALYDLERAINQLELLDLLEK